ncbi:hypothetical protein [Metallosphaera hakonensis]|nr:hypothetical protein [Metallosphaera hakonensis]
MVSIQGSSVSYTLVSREPFVMSFEHGNVKLDREVKVTKSTSWKEAKPHRLAWDVMNPVLDLDCKPKFKVSLFRIEPSSVVPVFLKYDGGINMGLLNMDDRPVISNIYLAARITSASITDPRSMVEEGMEPEFDRIRVPIRRWGYLSIHLEVKRLLEGLLKRKIISS